MKGFDKSSSTSVEQWELVTGDWILIYRNNNKKKPTKCKSFFPSDIENVLGAAKF